MIGGIKMSDISVFGDSVLKGARNEQIIEDRL